MNGKLKSRLFACLTMLASASAQAQSFMPTEATKIATQVDNLYSFLLWASGIACVIVIGGMIFFAIKYRRKTDTDKTPYISHNTFLEFLWSFIPLVIFLAVFAWGWVVYHNMRAMPKDGLEVHVMGRQWAWDFTYKSGKTATNEFLVPVNTPVKLIMTAKDVLHSFYIPSMRIKQDVIPGQYTALWFNSDKLGDFHVFCTEFCGTSHSAMIGKLRVVTLAEYEAWLQENDANLTMEQLGEKLYVNNCKMCHSTDGSQVVGPSFKGIFNHEVELADGSKVMADENYIRESILNPQAKLVKGFPPSMPPFQGQFNEDQLNALIEFIKGRK